MGLFPPYMILVLVLLAAALTAQQRLALASHNAAFPARQIAYQMRVYHQSSVNYKLANGTATGVITSPPPSLSSQFYFTSCADAENVVTFVGGASAGRAWAGGLGAFNNQSVAAELARQSISPPELGLVSQSSRVTGYLGVTTSQAITVPGIGLSTGSNIQTGYGLVALPAGCTVPAGVPAMLTGGL